MPFLQMRDLRLREVQELAKGRPAAKWKISDSNQFYLLPKPSFVSLHRAASRTRCTQKRHSERGSARQTDGLPDQLLLRGLTARVNELFKAQEKCFFFLIYGG